MRRFITVMATGLLAASLANAANVTVSMSAGEANSNAGWEGFMNVSNLPAPDGDGAFQFGSGWGVPDLNVAFDDANSKFTFSPNTIGDPDPYWYQGGGGPGAPGNKIMEANLFQTFSDGSLSGVNVNFSGVILSNSFTSAHTASIFIRDFAPDFSSFNETIVPAVPGPFSIDLLTDAGAGRNVQVGFQVSGVNVWAGDEGPFGNMMVATVPEPATLALLALAGMACLRRR